MSSADDRTIYRPIYPTPLSSSNRCFAVSFINSSAYFIPSILRRDQGVLVPRKSRTVNSRAVPAHPLPVFDRSVADITNVPRAVAKGWGGSGGRGEGGREGLRDGGPYGQFLNVCENTIVLTAYQHDVSTPRTIIIPYPPPTHTRTALSQGSRGKRLRYLVHKISSRKMFTVSNIIARKKLIPCTNKWLSGKIISLRIISRKKKSFQKKKKKRLIHKIKILFSSVRAIINLK